MALNPHSSRACETNVRMCKRSCEARRHLRTLGWTVDVLGWEEPSQRDSEAEALGRTSRTELAAPRANAPPFLSSAGWISSILV